MCGRIIYIYRERERERGCCSVYVCTFVPVCIHTYNKAARFLKSASSSSSHSFYFCVLLLVVAGFGGRKTKRTDW